MSGEKVLDTDKELGHSENDLHNGRDIEKYSSSITDDADAQNSSRISHISSRGEEAHISREPSLARTRSKQSNVVTRVASRLTTRSIKDPGPPPDGGFRAWLQCFCGWLAICNTWGFALSFGAFQTYYAEILPQSPSTISWIGSLQACLIFLVGAFSGRALDAGLFRPTIIVGIIIQLIGIFTMSLAKKYWHLLLTQGVLTGIGGGLFFCPVMGLMSTYFLKRRGLALGIATTGNSVGGLVYPVIVRQLLPKIGFGWTVRVLGLLNLVTLALVVILMKPRLPPRKSGPIVEWTAIKDIPYVLFVIGCCFLMAAVYFVFYYVSRTTRYIHKVRQLTHFPRLHHSQGMSLAFHTPTHSISSSSSTASVSQLAFSPATSQIATQVC
jgi:MFS family permease